MSPPGQGRTPLLALEVQGRRVQLKLEYLSPTGSFKERGAATLMAQARALGVREVIEDSSGNAGLAIAAQARAAGLACRIYVPASTSPGKTRAIEAQGATLLRVPGPRQAAAEAAMRAAASCYYASHVWQPAFIEGVAVIAGEIFEQLGRRAPDALVLPTGNGTLLLGAWRGFLALKAAGLIPRLPRLIAVQAEGCAPLAGDVDPAARHPLAEGIAIARPVRLAQMRQAIASSGGEVAVVSNDELRAAQDELLRRGHDVEPTAAVAFAAWSRMDWPTEANVVVPLTGRMRRDA